jgi:hypothetical protein
MPPTVAGVRHRRFRGRLSLREPHITTEVPHGTAVEEPATRGQVETRHDLLAAYARQLGR